MYQNANFRINCPIVFLVICIAQDSNVKRINFVVYFRIMLYNTNTKTTHYTVYVLYKPPVTPPITPPPPLGVGRLCWHIIGTFITIMRIIGIGFGNIDYVDYAGIILSGTNHSCRADGSTGG